MSSVNVPEPGEPGSLALPHFPHVAQDAGTALAHSILTVKDLNTGTKGYFSIFCFYLC